jgi:Flp pilus assembly protein TadG
MLKARPLRRVARFLTDRRGVVALEFGLVVFPFLAVLLATFEVGFVRYENELLVSAVSDAVRALRTGIAQGNANVTSASSFISNYVCVASKPNAVYNNFDCSKLVVDIRPVTSFASADMSNGFIGTATKFCPGAAGQVSLMRIAYPLPAIFPLNLFDPAVHTITVGGQTGNYHVLLGSALFQVENFSSNYTPPAGC